MEILQDGFVFLICLVAIIKGADWLVDSAAKIAHRFGVSELVIGLTIVAFGTSAPEFGVTILAAIEGMHDISVGNIVGSNIFNLGIILGGTAIIQNLKTTRKMVHRDGMFLLFGSSLLGIFLWDLKLSTIEGIILFVLLFVYIGLLYFKQDTVEDEVTIEKMSWRDPALLFLGFGIILIGSHFLVIAASNLARNFGVSEWVIGLTIVAAGTSAPEFVTSIVAALKGKHAMSVGNLLGSDIFNMFGVLGLAAIISNLSIDMSSRSSVLFLVAMVAIVLVFIRTGWVVTRREGIILVVISLARWAFDFLVK